MSAKYIDGNVKFDRQRKKRFYNTIRQQIEFYLGDVNLSKNRFFSDLLLESPYIDVDVILNCNKIKNFTTKPEDIVKAIKKSQILAVTDDGKKIYRTVPVEPIQNEDECTIYVEDLPMEADHEWLKNVFNKYGEILYVSVPLFKTTRKKKGFAFIQFATAESANQVLEAFRSANSCLSSTMKPGTLKSVQTFDGDKEIVLPPNVIPLDALQFVPNEREKDENRGEDKDENDRKVRQQDKRLMIDDSYSEIPTKRKKKYRDQDTDYITPPVNDDLASSEIPIEEETKKKKKEHMEEPATEDIMADNDITLLKSKGRKRKRKKVKDEPVQTYGMQILSKKDWKKLRNKYLEDQRKRMHEVKQILKRTHLCQNDAKPDEEDPNFGDCEVKEEKKNSESRVKFTPGVIIKLRLDEPIKNVKTFKTEVKRYANVEYIDASENSNLVYFRCSSNEIANEVIGLNRWPHMCILTGDDEQAYWEKIRNDRREKIELKIKSGTRGKNKLMKKVESAFTTRTHIKFPE